MSAIGHTRLRVLVFFVLEQVLGMVAAGVPAGGKAISLCCSQFE
jgi:hypothetical protein